MELSSMTANPPGCPTAEVTAGLSVTPASQREHSTAAYSVILVYFRRATFFTGCVVKL
jgi:hypothetical protein